MAAKLVDKRLHNIPGKLRVAELLFDVPLNYSKPNDGNLRLFARSVRRTPPPFDTAGDDKQLPWLVYLQGGPGFGCRPPQDNGWVGTALDKGYQVLFLDQRGTGLSSTITAGTLALQGNAVKQAEYLKHFRADNIVRDCEAVRRCLTTDYPQEKRKWSIIGQSFGGFCAVTYLSMFEEKVEQRNQAYYAKFPEDIERVRRIVQYLSANDITIPSGKLTPERFQQLGILFGMHDIVLRANNDLDMFGVLTYPTLTTIDSNGGFDSNVIYAILHEAIYCQGQASNWSASRIRSVKKNFQINVDLPQIWFTGEMIFRDMFDSYDELNKIKNAADILAMTNDWPALYDEAKLAKNEVPVYAATYVEDMYVHYDYATNTAAKIKGIKQFITNVMYHNALRSKTDELMQQLFALREDTID
ncbi:hypothetical protein ATERTT37_004505 [Aspergillus terreus]